MSVTSILSKLKEINESDLIDVHIPSANKNMTFKSISVKQQKDLIKSGMDGALAGITISNVINQIITDNSTEKYDFLVVDKIPIILSLRNKSFGSVFTLKNDDKNVTFNLNSILKNKLQFSNIEKTEIKSEENKISVELSVISLEEDTKINAFQLEKLKKNKDEDLSETVGSLFVYEILKFISKITVGSDEIIMKDFQIKDRLTIVENLPASVNNEILEYIQSFRKEEMEYITVNGETLPIDARLFSKE
jgi:hypothetical protein